jgi:hypothetical protein
MIPSLIALARTPVYPAFRIGVALVGLLFSVSWMLERAALTSSDPFEGIQTWLVEHPLHVAGAVAALALVARRAATASTGSSGVSACQSTPVGRCLVLHGISRFGVMM